jgi:uncharacterized membrane protein
MLDSSFNHFNIKRGTLSRRVLLASVIVITLAGFYLRFRCLGCLGFRWDEDLTSLAVKALLEKNVPELPSGMIYVRFYPFQWIIAASVKVFGFSEFSMRLPAVLFGTILIPTTFLVTRKLLSEPIALIVAACIAFSFTQVEMARTARMYAPFFFIYLLAAYSIFSAYYQNTERLFSPWVLPLALLALCIHQLAYSLVIFVLLAIPLRKSPVRTASLLTQAGCIGIAFIALKSVQEHYFYVGRRVVNSSNGSQPVSDEPGLVSALFQQVTLPDFDLLLQVYAAFPLLFPTVLATVLASAMLFARDAWRYGAAYRALVLVAIVMSVTHQFNLVLLTLATMLMSLKGGLEGIRNPAWYRPAICCLSIFILWVLAIAIISVLFQSEVPLASQGMRKFLRALFDYPDFRLYWSFVLERPLLFLPLALGTMWGIDKISKDRPDATALFLVGGFWLVLFVNGILKTKFDFFRYNLHMDVFYLMLVVIGLYSVPALLANLGIPSSTSLRKYCGGRILTVIAAVIAIAGVNPVAATLTSTRSYKETAFPYVWLGLDHYDDFATPAAYVRDRLQENDIVLVLDPREFWNYIGRVDYWIWSDNYQSQTYIEDGRARDLYLGIPVLHSLEDVKAVLDGYHAGNIWILYSKARLDRTRWISEDLKSYLNGLEDHVVYVGHDEQTVVIELSN